MSETNEIPTHLTSGDTSVEIAKLSWPVQVALMQGKFNHLMGNEVASKVTSAIRSAIVKVEGVKADEVTKEHIVAYRAANPDAVATMDAAATAEAVKSLLDGTYATSARAARGPVDPVGKEAMAIALKEVSAIYAENKIAATKAILEAQAKVWYEAHAARLREDAEKAIAAASRKVAKMDPAALALLGLPAKAA